MNNIISALSSDQVLLLVLLGLMLVVMVIYPMFTSKRRERQVNEMYNAVKPGCQVMTKGGIIGIIVELNEITPLDKEIVLETGIEGRKSTIVFDINAIALVLKNPDGTPYSPLAARAAQAWAQEPEQAADEQEADADAEKADAVADSEKDA